MAKAGVVAFAFGAPANIYPNALIARMAVEKAHGLKAKIFTQRDIQICRSANIEVVYIEEGTNSPPPTLQIARAAVRWARQQRIRELWIAAAGPHVWRCQRDLERAISEAETEALIKVRICEGIKQREKDIWYSPSSSALRTRSALKWWTVEIILRILPMFIYKRVVDQFFEP